MPSEGELTDPPLYLVLPPVTTFCDCPFSTLVHCTVVTLGLPLTVHYRVTNPPTVTEYVLKAIVAVGKSVK